MGSKALEERQFFGILLLFFLCLSVTTCFSQPADVQRTPSGPWWPSIIINKGINVVQGSPAELMRFKNLKVRFDYSETRVCGYRNAKEYLEDKYQSKGPEQINKQLDLWNAATRENFEPGFIELMAQKLDQVNMAVVDGSGPAELILTVKIYELEPHEHFEERKKIPSYIYAYCYFESPEGHLFVTFDVTAYNSRGDSDFTRLEKGYSTAGGMLGGTIAQCFIDIVEQQEFNSKRK
jgi:hypothetical protein